MRETDLETNIFPGASSTLRNFRILGGHTQSQVCRKLLPQFSRVSLAPLPATFSEPKWRCQPTPCNLQKMFWLQNQTQTRQFLRKPFGVLAGVAQWTEHWPVNQRVISSIPSQGTCLGYGPGPQLGAQGRQRHSDVSLPPFPSV